MKNSALNQPRSLLFTVRLIFFVLLVTALATIILQPVYAATGIRRTINFQGKLVNKTDGTNVADGTYSFTFKFFNASSGGTQLPSGSAWSETQNLTVTDGIFRAELGSSTVIPTNLDFNDDSIYLDITFNGETFSSRVRMTAVPYAFNAEKVNGLNVTATNGTFTLASGKTLTANNTLTFAGTDSTTITFQGTDTYVGRSTTDTLTNKTIGSTGLTFSGATVDITTASNENLVISPNGSGQVGIGTTSPTALLHVAGNTLVAGTASLSGDVVLGDANTDKVTINAGSSGSGISFGDASFQSCGALSTNSSGVLVCTASVTSAGGWTDGGSNVYLTTTTDNVGIGTTAPGTKLDIVGTLRASGAVTLSNYTSNGYLRTTGGNGTLAVGTTIPTTDLSGTILSSTADSGSGTLVQGDILGILGGTNGIDTSLSGDTYTLNFDSTEVGTTTWGSGSGITWTFDASAGTDPTIAFGSSQVIVTAGTASFSGNVGIGTTAPGFTLEVNGTSRINGNFTIGDASGDSVTVNSSTWTFTNDTNVTLSGGTAGLNFDTATLSIDASNDRVGIGTTAPQAVLHSNGIILTNNAQGFYSRNAANNANYRMIELTSADNTIIGPNGVIQLANGAPSNALYIKDSTGNVGIGTTNPSALFSVGSTSQFQVNSSGAIAAATGITSSGTINFSGLSTNGYVRTTGGTGTLAVGTTIPTSDLSGTILSSTADSGSGTLVQGDILGILGGTNGIDTSLSGDTYTLNFDSTEVGTTTWGSGSGITWTFDASAGTDPTVAFGSSSVAVTAGTASFSGNVGIGTTAPGFTLEVNGTSRINGNFTIGDAAGDTLTVSGSTITLSQFTNGGSGCSALETNASGVLTCGTDDSGGMSGWTDGGTNVYLTTDTDNVGIGTTAPGTKLDIVGTLRASGAVTLSNYTSNGYLRTTGGNGTLAVGTTIPTTDLSGTILSSTADSGSGTLVQGDILGILGGTNGIDTSLSGDTYTLNFDSTEVGTTTWGSGSGITWTFDASAGTDPTIAFASSRVAITAGTASFSGRLGIGTTAPEQALHVSGNIRLEGENLFQFNTNGDIGYVAGGAGQLLFRNASSEKITITTLTSGNIELLPSGTSDVVLGVGASNDVGIGTSTPIGRLQVVGDEVRIGDTGSVGTATGDGDLYIEDALEVDGATLLGDAAGDSLTIAGLSVTLSAFTSNGYLRTTGGNGTLAVGTTIPTSDLSGTILSSTADSGSGTLVQGDILGILGGTNGIDTSLSGDTYTLNLDTTEIGTTTFGSGSGITWTFDASAGTDPTIAFGSSSVAVTAGTASFSGNVGIGTTAPGYKLEVNGNIAVIQSGNSPAYYLGDAATAGNYGFVQWNSPSDFVTIGTQTGGSTLNILESGNVGIGTTAPGTTLDIVGTLRASGAVTLSNYTSNGYLRTTGGNGTLAVGTTIPTTDLSGTILSSTADSGSGTLVQGDILGILGGTNGIDTSLSGDTYTLNFDSTEVGTTTFGSGSGITWTFDASAGTDPTVAFGSSQVIVTAGTASFSGNVGIGTTAPGFTLEVNGTSRINGNFTIGDAAGDTLTVSGSTITLSQFTNGGSGCSALETNASGVLTCGTDDVGGGSSGWTDGGTNVYLTTDTDNVGIGTTAPGFKLEVNGTARVNGNFTIGDASGDAVTVNASTWTFANDTNVTLSGGAAGLNFDTATLSINAASDRVGIGTTAPDYGLEVRFNNFGVVNPAGASQAFIIAGTNSESTIYLGNPDNVYAGGMSYNNSTGTTTFYASGNSMLTLSNTGTLNLGVAWAGGELRMVEDNGAGGTDTVTLAAGNISSSYSLTLPTGAGGLGECLKTDSVTASQLVFGSCGSGSSPWTDGGTDIYLATVTDQVGIGLTNPAYALDLSYTDTSVSSWNAGQKITFARTGTSGSYNGGAGLWIAASNAVTGAGVAETVGVAIDLNTANDSDSNNVLAFSSNVTTYANDAGYHFYLTDNNSSGGGVQYGIYINLDDTDVTRYGIYQESANDNYFAGDVGIGTTAPSDLLTISTGTNDAGILIRGANSTGGISPSLKFADFNGTQYARIGIAGAANNMSFGSSQNDLVIRTENKNIHFNTNAGSDSAFVIGSNGNVGVGTTSTSSKLEVYRSETSNGAIDYFRASDPTTTEANSDFPIGRLREYFATAGYGVWEGGGFINLDGSFYMENFTSERASVTAENTNATAYTSRFGDNLGWYPKELGAGGTATNATMGCVFGQNTVTSTERINGVLELGLETNSNTNGTNLTGPNCYAYLGNTLQTGTNLPANAMLRVANKFILYYKVKPSAQFTNTPSNKYLFFGADNNTIGWHGMPTVTHTNKGGMWINNVTATGSNAAGETVWRALARSGTSNSTASFSCSAGNANISTSAYALARLEARATNDVRFFIDADVSNGVNLSNCTASVTSNVITQQLRPAMNVGNFTSFTNTTALWTAYVDLFAYVQDDPRNLGGQVAGITSQDSVSQPSAKPSAINGADLAEQYIFGTDDEVEHGDIVSLGDFAGEGDKSKRAYDRKLLGVVSESPGLIMGESSGDTLPVALTGRVPVKVSNKNGAIKIGDPITSSDISGVGMKATKPGKILGTAMEAFDAESGKVMVNINVSYYLGDEGDTALIEGGQDELGLGEGSTASISAQVASDSAMVASDSAMIAKAVETIKNSIFKGAVEFWNKVTFKSVAEYLAEVFFKSNVHFEGQVEFSNDTAGYATIKQSERFVDVKFDREYRNEPIVNISISIPRVTDEKFKELIASGDCDAAAGVDACQDHIASQILADDMKAAVAAKTTQGFIIMLNRSAPVDVTFSWQAVAVKEAKTSVSRSTEELVRELQKTASSSASGSVAGEATSAAEFQIRDALESSSSSSSRLRGDASINKQKGTIKETELGYVRLRSTSSTAGEEILQIPSGTEISIIATENGWYQVTYKGKTGWVSGEYVSKS